MEQENVPVAQPAPQPPESPPAHPAKAASNRAMATLILGILALICMGFVAGIPAIILGSMELKAIKGGQAPQEGEGLARVGYILGIIGTILTCLAMTALIAIIALGVATGTTEGVRATGYSI